MKTKPHTIILFTLASALCACSLLRAGGRTGMAAAGAAGGAAVGGPGGAAVGGMTGHLLGEVVIPPKPQVAEGGKSQSGPGTPPPATKKGLLGGVKSAWYVASYWATHAAIWVLVGWLVVGLAFGRFRQHVFGFFGALFRLRLPTAVKRAGAAVGFVHTERTR